MGSLVGCICQLDSGDHRVSGQSIKIWWKIQQRYQAQVFEAVTEPAWHFRLEKNNYSIRLDSIQRVSQLSVILTYLSRFEE